MSTQQHYLQPGALSSSGAEEKKPVNVNEMERLISGIVGTCLVKHGLGRMSLGGLALAGLGGGLLYRAVTGHCGVYETLSVSSRKPAQPARYFDHGVHVRYAVTVDRTPEDLYAFWKKFENLPSFMRHLKSVTVLDDKTSRWVAAGPGGTRVQWDSEIINDEPNRLIAWRSLGGAQVDNAGSVKFLPAPGGRGTEVHVVLDYIPPGRSVGKWIAKLFGEEPQLQIEEDLHRFKQLIEAGEIPTIKGQSQGQKQPRD